MAEPRQLQRLATTQKFEPRIPDRTLVRASSRGIARDSFDILCASCQKEIAARQNEIEEKLRRPFTNSLYSQKQIGKIFIALTEAVFNFMEHGMSLDDTKCMQVKYEINERGFRLELSREGNPFSLRKFVKETIGRELEKNENPLNALEKHYDAVDVIGQIDNPDLRGRGIVIMHKLTKGMDGRLAYKNQGRIIILTGKRIENYETSEALASAHSF